jgi:hypothetical protein
VGYRDRGGKFRLRGGGQIRSDHFNKKESTHINNEEDDKNTTSTMQ